MTDVLENVRNFIQYSDVVLKSQSYKELSGASFIVGTKPNMGGSTLYFHEETRKLNKHAAPFFYVEKCGPIILSWEKLALDWVAFIAETEVLDEVCFKVFWDKILHPS